MPDIPLSAGKLELLSELFFAKFPYTSPYTHVFVRVCIILPCIYLYIILAINIRASSLQLSVWLYTMYMTDAPRVLHFSAFILSAVILILLNKGRYDFALTLIYGYHFFITKVLVKWCL